MVLLREGEVPASFFLIEAGAVEITCVTPSGRMATLAILGRGEVFGLEGLASGNPEDPVTLPEARTLLPSRIASTPLWVLSRSLEDAPEVAGWLIAAAHRLLQQELAMVRTLSLPVPHRALSVLMELARRHGRAVNDGLLIELPISQETLARMVGASREAVNRALRRLLAEGVIRRSGRRYVLIQSEAAVSSNRSTSVVGSRMTRPSRSSLMR
jgi:CRP-like cAMP-binding protein